MQYARQHSSYNCLISILIGFERVKKRLVCKRVDRFWVHFMMFWFDRLQYIKYEMGYLKKEKSLSKKNESEVMDSIYDYFGRINYGNLRQVLGGKFIEESLRRYLIYLKNLLKY